MSSSIKSFHVALVLIAVLVLSLSWMPNVYSTEWSAEKRTLSFLTDVVMLDLASYNVELLHHNVSYPVEYGGIMEEEISLELKTNGSQIRVIACFRNKTLAFCLISVREGSPVYTKAPPTNLVDSAKTILEEYQTYSESSRLQEMKGMLDQIDKVKETTVTSGNVKLQVSNSGRRVSFNWQYTYGGVEVSGPTMVFRDGALYNFVDIWNIFTVGNTAIKVSEKEAINIAKETAKNFSWTVDGVEIKDFVILEDPVQTKMSMQAREPLTLYPHWRVNVYLDTVYPGGVSCIAVGVWADTGEVRYCQELSLGGRLSAEETQSATIVPLPHDSTGQTNLYQTVILIAVILVLTMVIVSIKKRHK